MNILDLFEMEQRINWFYNYVFFVSVNKIRLEWMLGSLTGFPVANSV